MYTTAKTVRHFQVGDMGLIKDGYPDGPLHDCYAVVLKLEKTVWNNGCGHDVEMAELPDDESGDIVLLFSPVKCFKDSYVVRTSMHAMRKYFRYLTHVDVEEYERTSLLRDGANMHLLYAA